MTTTLVVCPSCGAENQGTRFCESCGAPAPALAPVQPTAVGVPALGNPAGGVAAASGALHAVALRGLAVGAVATILFPGLTGAILVLLGGLPVEYYYADWYWYWAGSQHEAFYVAGFGLAWPLTLILVVLTAAAGVVAGLTSDRSTGVKAGAIALALTGAGFLGLFGILGALAWIPGGVAIAAAWLLLAELRGWAYLALLAPLVTGILAVFAYWGARAHVLVGPPLHGVLAAGTVVGVVLAGRMLGAAYARRPPRPVPAPLAPGGAPPGAVPPPPPPPGFGPGMTGPVYPTGAVATAPLMATGPVMPGVVVAQPGYMVMPVARTNGLAVAALVFGLLGGSVLPIIFGHVALSQIRRTGERGAGMATAGLVLGYISAAVWLIILISLLGFAGWMSRF